MILSHIEIRQTGHTMYAGRHVPNYTVFVVDTDGHIFESRQFTNPDTANRWAESWGFPPRLVDGWL